MKAVKYFLFLSMFISSLSVAGEIGHGTPDDDPNFNDETSWWDELLSSEDVGS